MTMPEFRPDPLPDTTLPTDLIDAKTGARLLKAHLSTVHRWRLSGKVRAWRRGKLWFFSRAELLGVFQAQQPPQPAERTATRREMDAWTKAELIRHGMIKPDEEDRPARPRPAPSRPPGS